MDTEERQDQAEREEVIGVEWALGPSPELNAVVIYIYLSIYLAIYLYRYIYIYIPRNGRIRQSEKRLLAWSGPSGHRQS